MPQTKLSSADADYARRYNAIMAILQTVVGRDAASPCAMRLLNMTPDERASLFAACDEPPAA